MDSTERFDPAMTHYQIALAQTYQKKWNEAKTAFDHCLEADNGFAHAYYYRARVFKELGNTEQMLIDLDMKTKQERKNDPARRAFLALAARASAWRGGALERLRHFV